MFNLTKRGSSTGKSLEFFKNKPTSKLAGETPVKGFDSSVVGASKEEN